MWNTNSLTFKMTHCISRLEKTLTHSQFVDPPEEEEDDSDDDQIIETDEELRKSKVTFNYLQNVCILILTLHRSLMGVWVGVKLKCT